MRTSLYGVVILLVAAALMAAGCSEFGFGKELAIDHYVRGQLLADKGDSDAALEELAKAVRDDPELSAAHAAAGDIYRKRGSYEMAKRSYEAACKVNPYAFRPHYNLGVTYQLMAESAGGFAQVQSTLQQAVLIYLRAAEIDPEDFDTKLNLCACYFQLGKYDLAEQYCLSAIEIRRNSAEAYSNLGAIYDGQNRLYEAIRAYKASLEIEVRQPNLWMNLGATFLRQNRTDQALLSYQQAVKYATDSSAAWQQIGFCQYQMRKYDEAMAAYRKAIETDSSNAEAHRGLGVVYMSQFVMDRTKTNLRDNGLAAWHRSLELNPRQNDLMELVQKYSPKPAGPQL